MKSRLATKKQANRQIYCFNKCKCVSNIKQDIDRYPWWQLPICQEHFHTLCLIKSGVICRVSISKYQTFQGSILVLTLDWTTMEHYCKNNWFLHFNIWHDYNYFVQANSIHVIFNLHGEYWFSIPSPTLPMTLVGFTKSDEILMTNLFSFIVQFEKFIPSSIFNCHVSTVDSVKKESRSNL